MTTFISNCRRFIFHTKLGSIFFLVLVVELGLTAFVVGLYLSSGQPF